jgi:hypothetical protein
MRAFGRVVSWDSDDDSGAVVVDGLPAEVRVPSGAAQTADGRDLQPGELVEIEYSQVTGGGFRAERVCPTDASD